MRPYVIPSLFFLVLLLPAYADSLPVQTLRVPNGGIQPQALTAPDGTIHLAFFKGDSRGGDFFYSKKAKGKSEFSPPMQVNSQAKSGIAAGSVRGIQIALGKNGRLHAVWNGNGKPKEAVFYSSLEPGKSAFEKQRNLIGDTSVMDGGASVAADAEGNVFVVWHAITGGVRGEGNRKVWVARSTDSGKSFAKETTAWGNDGVCPCCSLKAFASGGEAHILYRAVMGGFDRDLYWLHGKNGGAFEGKEVHKWRLPL